MKILKVGDVDVLLDDEDWLRLCRYKWQVKRVGGKKGTSYIARTKRIGKKFVTIYMHREIMNAPDNMEVHHDDENPYNNQKENLKLEPKPGHTHIHNEKAKKDKLSKEKKMDVEIACSNCGDELKIKDIKVTPLQKVTIKVAACERCLQRENDCKDCADIEILKKKNKDLEEKLEAIRKAL